MTFIPALFTAVGSAVSAAGAATASAIGSMSLSTFATIGSTALSAIGEISHGDAQAAGDRAQAQAQSYQAQINQMNANQISDEYAAKENAQRLQEGQAEGRMRAQIAESGIGIDSGTGQDLLQQQTIGDRMNDLTLRYEGQTRRTAALNDASMNTYQSQVASMNAGVAQQQGYLGALGSVFGGLERYGRYGGSDSSGASGSASVPSPSNNFGFDPLNYAIYGGQ